MTQPTTRRLASGAFAEVNAQGLVTDIYWDDPEPYVPTCSICDAVGHGYPGGPPCPLEDRGYDIDPREEARERYLEGLAEQRQEDRLDARDEAIEWGGVA